MLTKPPLKDKIEQFLKTTAPREQFRLGIFWSVIILSVLILGSTSYHIQSIPKKITANVNGVLDSRSWIQDLVVVDGRNVYLRGEVEPSSGLENEIARISDVPGVIEVSNLLDETPKPSPHFNLKKYQNQLEISGRLSGEFLEPIISLIETSFPDHQIKDRLKIDDRLGRPLWFEGFDQSLSQLSALDDFELNGWRDQIEITGTAENDLQRRQVGYAIPASLISQVNVVNRLKQKITESFPSVTLVSDWRGASINGTVSSETLRDQLLASTAHTFGTDQTNSTLQIQDELLGIKQLTRLIQLLPSLDQVRDLRLESSEKGFVVWGRVDDPFQLGRFLESRNVLGLDEVVRNEIFIAQADRSAAITLFSDQTRAILSGVLPTIRSRQKLIQNVKENLGVIDVVDLVSIEPNIAHSDWLAKWPKLLSELPKTVIGITIDNNSLLVTGNAQTTNQLTQIDQRLGILFPDQTKLNWLTASN